MRRRARTFLLALTLGILVTPVLQATAPALFRWGIMGHRMVGRIADGRLTPKAAAEVARLLDGGTLGSVANWADSFRVTHPETGPWHYVDIPTWESSYVPARDCPNDKCVIVALTAQIGILTDKARPRDERAMALRFVTHFIGDMHQPLHAGERSDKGGNDVKLTFMGKATNLHSVWDSGLLTALDESEDAIVARIDERLEHRGDIGIITSGSITDWAMESHDVARDVVYTFMPTDFTLGAEYLAEVRPVLEDRLLRGGVRLAAVVNRALDP